VIALVPLLSGRESDPAFISAVTDRIDKVILLQIIDKGFMNKTSAAMGEVMHYSSVMREAKKAIGAKKKGCDEITEWGATVQKIVSIAILQKVDKIFLVKQNNSFFDEVIEELKEKKLDPTVVELAEPEAEKKKKGRLF
jgi:hypothetical protein